MRALGLTASQLSRWLWLENGSLVVVSLICGTAVGVVISLIALPFVTVTQQATTPVPPVVAGPPTPVVDAAPSSKQATTRTATMSKGKTRRSISSGYRRVSATY